MTIGDVLAVVASVLGIALTSWSLLIGMTLLFRQRVTYARDQFEHAPKAALGIGVLLTATLGVLSIALLNHPHGLIKLIGWAMLLGLLGTSTLGAGGLAMLVNSRIRGMEPGMSEFTAHWRGAGILIIAGLMPVLGWFVFTPLVLITSLGAGVRAVLHKERVVTQTDMMVQPDVMTPAITQTPAPMNAQPGPAYPAPLVQPATPSPALSQAAMAPARPRIADGVEVQIP